MHDRRTFLSRLGALTAFLSGSSLSFTSKDSTTSIGTIPLVISTWNNHKANNKAWNLLRNGSNALDAVEQGIKVAEGDPLDTSVGYGGLPDRDGKVTLDACIMDAKGNAGSVSFIQGYKHPISIARKVMEETEHVILTGQGAADFAKEMKFETTDLLTPSSIKRYKEWLVESKYAPVINSERHDTIGMVAIDKKGEISGGCSTSGLAFKMHGRVGDSPIIGAGLFVDNEIGGAAATGMGELVLKTLGSFLVVEFMRNGLSPQAATQKAVERINNKYDCKDMQVGFVAVDKKGNFGGYSIHKGFQYIVNQSDESKLFDSGSINS